MHMQEVKKSTILIIIQITKILIQRFQNLKRMNEQDQSTLVMNKWTIKLNKQTSKLYKNYRYKAIKKLEPLKLD